MPDRDRILATLDGGLLAARADGDRAAMATFLAPGATFRIADLVQFADTALPARMLPEGLKAGPA